MSLLLGLRKTLIQFSKRTMWCVVLWHGQCDGWGRSVETIGPCGCSCHGWQFDGNIKRW